MFNLLRNYSYYDDYYYYDYPISLSNIDSEVVGIAVIASLVVAIIVYFTFLSKRNAGRFTGFVGWLYEVLNFGKLIIEALLKICYMFITLFISIISIIHMKDSFGEGLLMLIGFNVIIRICYECLLMIVMLCKNTKEINSKLKDQNNNTMNGGRISYNMPPQQSYGQSSYVQQPKQQAMNRQPMGMQQPMGAQRPAGAQQPAGAQPVRVQQPMGAQQPMNNHYQGSTGSMGPAAQAVNQDQGMPQVNSKQEELPKVQNVKYCLKCGNVVEHDDIFCPNCGTKVVE